MAWTTEQYKAIFDYSKNHGLKILMSTSTGVDPKVRFLNKQDEVVEVVISAVVQDYTIRKKEDQQQRKRIREEEKRKAKWHGYRVQ